jgi:hypothetical protein
MLLHSDVLSWFRTDQSLLFLLNTVCLAEKQQIPILQSLVWPDRGSNPRSTTFEASMLTITPPLRLSKEDKQHNGQKKKNKRTNNDLQNTDKTKDRVTRTPLKTIG